MIPVDETMAPTLNWSVGLFALTGLATAGFGHMVHNLPFYHRPHTLLIGTLIGATSGYFIHYAALATYKNLRIQREYDERYREFCKQKEASLNSS